MNPRSGYRAVSVSSSNERGGIFCCTVDTINKSISEYFKAVNGTPCKSCWCAEAAVDYQ